MSRIRKIYFARLVGRCLALIGCVLLCIFSEKSFDVLPGWAFFHRLSPLHLLWVVWMLDMISQLVPAKNDIALGSKKNFRQYFRPSAIKEDWEGLKRYILSTTRSAYKILIIWVLLIAGLGVLHAHGYIGDIALFMVSAVFYVCDLICVLIWCPFRLLLKNRCCTTCRIFNWDHLMMFTPMLFVSGFYARSLLIMSIIVFLVWEMSVLLHPERFWFQSNETLQCANCTDKLCTQYCQKLRPKEKE